MPRSPSLRTMLENPIYLWIRLCKHARSMKRQNFAGTREAGADELRNGSWRGDGGAERVTDPGIDTNRIRELTAIPADNLPPRHAPWQGNP